jgi:hypothetical protein
MVSQPPRPRIDGRRWTTYREGNLPALNICWRGWEILLNAPLRRLLLNGGEIWELCVDHLSSGTGTGTWSPFLANGPRPGRILVRLATSAGRMLRVGSCLPALIPVPSQSGRRQR